jgi:DUF1680 family protein
MNRRTLLGALPLNAVTIDDAFWSPRLRTNRDVTIPHAYALCKRSGRIDAFRLNWRPGKPRKPHYFWDSDVAKWVEAAAYSLATAPDAALRRKLDHVIKLIAGAQQADGYLNVYFTVVEPARRWTNLRDWHELYCAGHLIEAGVAHFEATGQRTLLDVVCRYADHIDATFGPDQRTGYPGHEEIELALVKLYRATGEKRYLDLATYFINERGRRPHFYDAEARARGEDPSHWEWDYTKNQSHQPVRRQREAVGHAVRAMYLYSGIADVAAESGDASLLTACKRLWKSVTRRKMYVTGGIGSVRRGEALGPDYFLPAEAAYAETCAACGLVFFAHRMLQIERHRDYADVMERALYNGVLSGVSLHGRRFFYENPLASAGGHHRQEWFDCACCPPNLARLLASLGRYIYSIDAHALYVHLYVGGAAEFVLHHQSVRVIQQTRYPWHGDATFTLELAQPLTFDFMLRVPGWCAKHSVHINGRRVNPSLRRGYLRLRRRWSSGDRVELTLEMPIRRITAHPRVADVRGKFALQRGPLLFCVEQCDIGHDPREVILSARTRLAAEFDPRLLGGTIVIHGSDHGARFCAIPYPLWDNRDPGTMAVFFSHKRQRQRQHRRRRS